MSKIKLLLVTHLILFMVTVDSHLSSIVHYITPLPTTQCPGKSCLTLSTLTANSSDYFDSNTTLVFLEGRHTLDSELVVSNINGSLMLSTNGSGTVAIVCSGEASLEFSNITQLQISGLEFIRCSIKVELVDHFTLEDSRFHGGNDGSALHLSHANTSIVRSSFVSNTAGTYQSHVRVLAYVRDKHNRFLYCNIHSTSGRVGGALIVTSSTVNISSSNFDNNTAKIGGAIFSQKGSNITISNCTFVNNSAIGCSDDGCHGGALFIDSDCTVTAHTSTFMNNTAGYGGGAIALLHGTFLDSAHNVFSSNSAGKLGGGISAYSRSRISIDKSCYSNNTGIYGGAIYTLGYGRITVSSSSFDNNEAGYYGGVMYALDRGSITVGNSSFDNNVAGRRGGVMSAVYISSITVGSSSFDNNEAGNAGGVMFNLAWHSSSVTMDNSFFDNNVAGEFGGVVYASSSSITVGNSSFDNNEAGNEAGVMFALYGSITVGNSSFNNNVAGRRGGVMSARYISITVVSSSFDNNESGRYGGVVSAWYSSITVGNSSFDKNVARSHGGVMYARDHNSITVGNSSFDKNVARSYGGVMYAVYDSCITVCNSSFDKNVARRHGGIMHAWRSSITVGNSSFDKNEAGNNGGAMSARKSSITVGNSSFENNEAGDDGGVMSAWDSSSITVDNSSFDKNVARRNGGVMYAEDGVSITVRNCSVYNNVAGDGGGVVYAYSKTTYTIFKNNCVMFNNSAHEGGVVYIRGSFKDLGSVFSDNSASNGGVIILDEGDVSILASCFMSNTAGNIGGVLYVPNYAYKHHITVVESIFDGNRATSGGVVALLANDNLTVTESMFAYNSAIRGGVIYLLLQNRLNIKYSKFSHNSAKSDGGVVYSADQNILTVDNSTFNFNRADNNGGVVCSLFQTKLTIMGDNCTFIGNLGHRGGVLYVSEGNINVYSRTLLLANNTAIDNGGAVYLSTTNIIFLSERKTIVGNVAKFGGAIFATDSHLKFSIAGGSKPVGNVTNSGGTIFVTDSHLKFSNGSSCELVGNVAHSGGAILIAESQLIFIDGSCKLVGNRADYGGAIHTSESEVVIEMNSRMNFNMSTNLAMHSGGGLYMTMSKLNAKGYNLYVTKNQAKGNGGGIHATNSSIMVEGVIHLINNVAENGGGITLERNAKLIGKSVNDSINLMSNRANRHGGALYVDDKTNPEMCAAIIIAPNEETSLKTRCFSNSLFFNFSDNSAGMSGTNLFGGLFDRCTVHGTESYQMSERAELGLASFQNSSNINESQLDTLSSGPVHLCFCRDSQPDCDYQPEPIQVNRGKAFSLQFVAYNHILKPVRAAVDIDSSASGKIAGHYIDKVCTEVVLRFNLSAQVDTANLTLSVEGPCNIAGISTKNASIQFICTCPIGFQIINSNNTSCDCVCDQVLQLYEKTECNPITESIIRRENFWISYINHIWSNSSGYVIYPHCPFDYCYTPDKSISVNLNLPNGSDTQCDSNRIGMLCGTCRLGLSVSLGSSKCIPCPTYWPGLLVTIALVFIISGIGLVAFLLALNLTVAIGTLNAIVFYANIVAANRSALFPSGVSPASVLISWLNFDLGFDVCFFNGLDTYVKTWLQLAFPAYIIILVVVIIQLSYYFTAFGRLVGKKDPVATLATLILLSYTKLLQTIITAFSSATLDYPDGSKKTLWLPDATLEYFTSKHAVLFFVAILILLAGLIYTFLLFSWQWFLWCPRKRVKLIRNQKLSSFIEIYLIPYTPKHRYWTGLLLLVRVSVYLVSAFNPSGDPRVTLSATNFIISSLFLYIATFGMRMYKNRFINTMETLTYFNIIALTIFTWYTIDADTNQTAVTNVSVGITFIQLIAVILYHAYKHTNQNLFAKIQGSVICIKMKQKLTPKKQKRVNNHKRVPIDEDIHQFHMLLDMIDRPVNTNDYNIPQIQPKPAEPTQSVVEIPKPVQVTPATPPSPPLEAIKEEQELESEQQQESQQDGIDMIPVTEENLATEINKNKQYINNCPGIEISECDDASCTNCTILKENSIPKLHSNSQINSYSDLKRAKEEAMEIAQSVSDGFTGSSSIPSRQWSAGGGGGSQCITVEAEIHDY